MVSLVSDFFGIVGIDLFPPSSFSAFIPWLLTVFVGISIVSFILKFFSSVARMIFGQRWL